MLALLRVVGWGNSGENRPKNKNIKSRKNEPEKRIDFPLKGKQNIIEWNYPPERRGTA
jgi:hypothetical protein